MFTLAPAKSPSRGESPNHSLFWWLVVLDLVLWVLAFIWQPGDLQKPPVVAVNVWPGSESFVAARELGTIQPETINFVELTWSTPAMRALGNRSMDAAILSLSEVALLRDSYTPLRIMLVLDESMGGDALVVKPGLVEVATIDHLKGRRVGVEVRSAGHYLLARALSDAGLSLGDVEIVPINLPESETAFADLQVDVVATAEPWLTKLLARGGRVLYDSKQTPGEFQRVLAVRDEVANQMSDSFRQLINAHFGLIEKQGWRDWPPAIRAGLGRREGLSKEDLAEAMSRVHLHSRSDQAGLLAGERPGLRSDFEKVGGAMLAAGMLQESRIPTVVMDGSLTRP